MAASKSVKTATAPKKSAPAKPVAAVKTAAKKSAPKAPKVSATAGVQAAEFTGTTDDLIKSVLLNGKPLNGPHLSILSSYGGCVVKVSTQKKNPGTRGKAANVLELRSQGSMVFTSRSASV